MAKRKMVQYNLVKNSIAAYFAAIEIHNKPNIPYRYETVSLLMINAWELMLKAFVKKYIKNRSIFENDGRTITLVKALNYANDYLNSKIPRSFVAIKENILRIEEYRNIVAHYYNDQLAPYIFMLIARCALNYVEFIKEHFSKDIMSEEELFIMPLGFKLPFKPEEFLSRNAPAYSSSAESRKFIESIIAVTTDLNSQGIDDSIVLGFNIYLESVKKMKNSDLLVAITSPEEANAAFTRITRVQLTDDPNAQIVNMSDNEFRNIWRNSHAEVVNWCRQNIPDFIQGKKFNQIKGEIKNDIKCVYTRRLDSQNARSASQDFYTDYALEQIKEKYLAG